jgi:hypothetical protein
MYKLVNQKDNLILFGVPCLIILAMVFIAKSSLFNLNPAVVSFGITFDLLLTTPLVYFLLIRKTTIPKFTVVTCFIAGLVIASFILPVENQYYLTLAKNWILPLIEASVLIMVIYQSRKAITFYKVNDALSPDFFTAVKNACLQILPAKAAIPLATEVSIFYYGFLNWKKTVPRKNEFTYHKDTATVALLISILFLIALEAAITHLLVAKWNPTVAWILTALSMYSAIQIVGVLKSIAKRPISIREGKLILYYGILSEAIIDLKDIIAVEISTKPWKDGNKITKLSPLGELESHNVIIRLKNEHTMTGFYGIKKKFKTLALHVDHKEAFKAQIEEALQLSCD